MAPLQGMMTVRACPIASAASNRAPRSLPLLRHFSERYKLLVYAPRAV
jgi:hypothetical protein